MNSEIYKSNLNENKKFENIINYEEYYLIKEKAGYKFIIGKRHNDIIIKCKNYELTFNNKDLSILIKSYLKTIDEAFLFIINIFEENKVIIKNIVMNKTITLILNIYINNKPKDIQIILIYNKPNNNNLIINECNNNYNKLEIYIKYLNNEINILKKEINKLKQDKNNNDIKINNNKIEEINNNKIEEINENNHS